MWVKGIVLSATLSYIYAGAQPCIGWGVVRKNRTIYLYWFFFSKFCPLKIFFWPPTECQNSIPFPTQVRTLYRSLLPPDYDSCWNMLVVWWWAVWRGGWRSWMVSLVIAIRRSKNNCSELGRWWAVWRGGWRSWMVSLVIAIRRSKNNCPAWEGLEAKSHVGLTMVSHKLNNYLELIL
jgi:hypothetical protein